MLGAVTMLYDQKTFPPSAVIVKEPPGTVSTKFPHCFMISRIIYVGIGFKRENKSFPTATGIKFPMLRSANIFIRQCISLLLFFWHHLWWKFIGNYRGENVLEGNFIFVPPQLLWFNVRNEAPKGKSFSSSLNLNCFESEAPQTGKKKSCCDGER